MNIEIHAATNVIYAILVVVIVLATLFVWYKNNGKKG